MVRRDELPLWGGIAVWVHRSLLWLREPIDHAHRSGYAACLLLFNVSVATCLARDSVRQRSVGEQVVLFHADLLQQALISAPQEGWDMLYVLDEVTMEDTELEVLE